MKDKCAQFNDFQSQRSARDRDIFAITDNLKWVKESGATSLILSMGCLVAEVRLVPRAVTELASGLSFGPRASPTYTGTRSRSELSVRRDERVPFRAGP